ncbi:hypothetical protein ACP4OV_016032 [Aristida adscensionis]
MTFFGSEPISQCNEQRINMLEAQVGVATRVKLAEDGLLVLKEEVANKIKRVMEKEEGERLDRRLANLGESYPSAEFFNSRDSPNCEYMEIM